MSRALTEGEEVTAPSREDTRNGLPELPYALSTVDTAATETPQDPLSLRESEARCGCWAWAGGAPRGFFLVRFSGSPAWLSHVSKVQGRESVQVQGHPRVQSGRLYTADWWVGGKAGAGATRAAEQLRGAPGTTRCACRGHSWADTERGERGGDCSQQGPGWPSTLCSPAAWEGVSCPQRGHLWPCSVSGALTSCVLGPAPPVPPQELQDRQLTPQMREVPPTLPLLHLRSCLRGSVTEWGP